MAVARTDTGPGTDTVARTGTGRTSARQRLPGSWGGPRRDLAGGSAGRRLSGRTTAGRWRTIAVLAATASTSLLLAWLAAVWLAPLLGSGPALIVWAGLTAALGSALPWTVLWLFISRRDQRSMSEGDSVSG